MKRHTHNLLAVSLFAFLYSCSTVKVVTDMVRTVDFTNTKPILSWAGDIVAPKLPIS